jgi:hypothetical protein
MIVITSTDVPDKCSELVRSLNHFGWEHHIIQHTWTGFLSKLHKTYDYLKESAETHFIYTDAWDTFVLGTPSELPEISGLLISAERNCYPYPELESQYPTNKSPWHFVNGGGWGGEVKQFLRLYESKPPTNEMNDQVWLTERFLALHHEGWVKLDCNCEVFQTIGFCEEDRDFDLPTRTNKITNSMPLFWHGNGHTPMNNIYKQI